MVFKDLGYRINKALRELTNFGGLDNVRLRALSI